MVECGFIFRLVKILGLFIGGLGASFIYFMVLVCILGVFGLVYGGFVSGEGCLAVGMGHLVVFLTVFIGIVTYVWGISSCFFGFILVCFIIVCA